MIEYAAQQWHRALRIARRKEGRGETLVHRGGADAAGACLFEQPHGLGGVAAANQQRRHRGVRGCEIRALANDRAQLQDGVGHLAAQEAGFPVNETVMNLPEYGRYKTVEASINKRYGNRLSASMGGSYTWRT